MILEYCYLFITKDNKSRHQNRRVNGTIKNANVAGGYGGGGGGVGGPVFHYCNLLEVAFIKSWLHWLLYL